MLRWGGGNGVELIDSLVKIEKWSDGEQSEVDRDGAIREESAEVKNVVFAVSWKIYMLDEIKRW